MSKAYTELYYHVIWATWKRIRFLTADIEENVYRYIVHKCKDNRYHCFGINGIEDHIHIVLSLEPTVAIATAVQKLKGSSSHFINHELKLDTQFKWQEGYGALTFGKRNLSDLVGYVRDQKQRHAEKRLNGTLENCKEA